MNSSAQSADRFWRDCSSCKKPIGYSTKFYECNVSTCTGKRTGYVFCSISCWEAHLPQAKHRDAWAVEKHSPSFAEAQAQRNSDEVPAVVPAGNGGRRLIVKQQGNITSKASMPAEILVVVSKMKQYIKERADMNTAGEVADVLSDLIRRACDDAIDQARADGRKTIMARDFKV